MISNAKNSEFEVKFADSIEVLTNIEYLWTRSEPLSVEQAGYLGILRHEAEKLEELQP